MHRTVRRRSTAVDPHADLAHAKGGIGVCTRLTGGRADRLDRDPRGMRGQSKLKITRLGHRLQDRCKNYTATLQLIRNHPWPDRSICPSHVHLTLKQSRSMEGSEPASKGSPMDYNTI